MPDARNSGTITGGLVAAPEVKDMKNGKIVKLRIAVPFAGNDRSTDDKRGFFDVTVYAEEGSPMAKFVLGQIEGGHFKPGTTLQILYRLVHERWESDEKKQSRVVLVAEALNYAGSMQTPQTPTNGAQAEQEAVPAKF